MASKRETAHTAERIWTCKIGGKARDLPGGSDLPMRKAVEQEFFNLTDVKAEFCFSGWGGYLTEPERAAHKNRLPSEEHHRDWQAHQVRADAAEAILEKSVIAHEATLDWIWGAFELSSEDRSVVKTAREAVADIRAFLDKEPGQ